MRNFRLFTFIKDGFKGVFRNGLMSVASILVLLSSLLVTGIFLTLVLNVNFNLEKLDNFNEVVCYLKLDSNAEQGDQRGRISAFSDLPREPHRKRAGYIQAVS